MDTVHVVNFWSKRLRDDVALPAKLIWLNSRVGEVWMAEYEGERLIRLRDEHALLDPYFRYSNLVKRELRQFSKDVVQFNSPEFDRLYPQHKQKREDEGDAKERYQWETSSSGNTPYTIG